MRKCLLMVVATVAVVEQIPAQTYGPPQAGFPGQRTRNAEWVTSGADAQRSRWIPNEPKISVEGLQHGSLQQAGLQAPGFQFLWKSKLANTSTPQLNSLSPAIVMDRYIGYRGFRSFVFTASG